MLAPKNGHTILIGEDELEVRGYLEMAVKYLGYGVEVAQDGEEVVNCLRTSSSGISAVLLDLMMPQLDGIETLKTIRRISADLPVIVISGASSTTNVVTAMKCGANDFLCKPVAHDDLERVIRKALETQNAISAHPAPRAAIVKSKTFIGPNPQMEQIYVLAGQIGWSEAPVLIQGETGSGKEVLARELHANSPRADKPFIKLNCAALPSELVESELFGYERGAFTGAFQKKSGMFEMADGGTLFLDEIGDMDVSLQAKLLQVLQDQEFRRIGGRDMISVDVRVMAATHRDLEHAIAENKFREDLYYRLNVVNVHIPSLRERREDILPLAEYLLKKHAPDEPRPITFGLVLKNALTEYHWPGNVRELENVIRRFLVLRDANVIARELQAKSARKSSAPAAAAPLSIATRELRYPAAATSNDVPILEKVTQAKEQAEVETILAALNSTRWNRKQAATLLKIDYKALLYKMKKLGVEKKAAAMTPGPPEELQISAAVGGR
jgi:two-component system, NtrC family, response regulator AtoC